MALGQVYNLGVFFLFYVRYFWCFMFIDNCFSFVSSCLFPRTSTVPVETVHSNFLTNTNSRHEDGDLTDRSISALNESLSPPKYVLSLLPSYEDRQKYPPGSPPPRYKIGRASCRERVYVLV